MSRIEHHLKARTSRWNTSNTRRPSASAEVSRRAAAEAPPAAPTGPSSSELYTSGSTASAENTVCAAADAFSIGNHQRGKTTAFVLCWLGPCAWPSSP